MMMLLDAGKEVEDLSRYQYQDSAYSPKRSWFLEANNWREGSEASSIDSLSEDSVADIALQSTEMRLCRRKSPTTSQREQTVHGSAAIA